MVAQRIILKVRDRLVEWGLMTPPRFYLSRHPVGAVRTRLQGRGSARRFRHTSLQRLLR